MTHFTPEQTQKIHEAAEKFRAAIAAGPQGQIEDGDSPAKVALMRKLLDSEEERQKFLEGAMNWSLQEAILGPLTLEEEAALQAEYQMRLDAEESCPYSHEWGDVDEDGCEHCGFYSK